MQSVWVCAIPSKDPTKHLDSVYAQWLHLSDQTLSYMWYVTLGSLNVLSHTIYCKILILILGISDSGV